MIRLGVDRLGFIRLGSGQSGATMVTQSDGVWNPQPGTWAESASNFIDYDARIHVTGGVQVPFSTLAVPGADGFQTFPRGGNYLGGYTSIIEFVAPTDPVPIGSPLTVLKFFNGSEIRIVRKSQLGDGIVGRLEFYSGISGEITMLSWVQHDDRMRWVTAVRQIGAILYQYQSVDGAEVVLTEVALPPGVTLPRGDFQINSQLRNFHAGTTAGWPFSDTPPDADSAVAQWLRTSSTRSVGNEITAIPMYPDFIPEPVAVTQTTVQENTAVEPIATAVEPLFDYTNYVTQHNGSGAGTTHQGQGRFDAWSASWSEYRNHYDASPLVSRITITTEIPDGYRPHFAIAIGPGEWAVEEGIEQGMLRTDVYTIDPPVHLAFIQFSEHTSMRSRVKQCKVEGPPPLHADGEPLIAEGVFVYAN